MKKPHKIKKIILLAGDVLTLYLSLYLTLLIRYLEKPDWSDWQSHFWPFTIVFFGWLIIFYISNLYDLHLAVNNARFMQRAGRALIISALLSAAFFYLTPQITIAPKRNLLIYIVVFAALFYLWRQFFNWLLSSRLPKNNLAIIGFNKQAAELAEELKKKPHLGYRVSLIFSRGEEEIKNNLLIPVVENIAELPELAKKKKIAAIILAASPHQSAELRDSLFACLPLKISFVNLSDFYENITGKVPIEAINQMWFLENLSEGSKEWFDLAKTVYDFLLAFFLLLVSSPFWLLVALSIKLDSRGPVFFKQARLGKNGRSFTIIKFRTMKTTDNDYSPTREKDDRVTRVGRFLRKTRIDELPQMLNIIRGEMSFVGPRPERPELAARLREEIPFYRERMLAKPGLTGWDQVSGEYHSPSREDTLKKLQYDLYYIKNRSLYLDLSIILKTIATILSKEGL